MCCEPIVERETEKPFTSARKLAAWVRNDCQEFGYDGDDYPCGKPEFKKVEWEIILNALDRAAAADERIKR